LAEQKGIQPLPHAAATLLRRFRDLSEAEQLRTYAAKNPAL
jgi:hypothetical protein